MSKTIQKIGTLILVLGLILLVTGVVFAFRVSSEITPVLLFCSIIANSLGITLIRSGRNR